LLVKYYPTSKTEKIHEKITVDIITETEAFKRILDEEQRAVVRSIIAGGGPRDYRRDIVSSNLDADKMDYLLRDAYYAGVRYGHYDLDKVIEACRIAISGPETFLAVDEEGLFAVEQLVLSKHHMTQQVYAHRIRVITDAMIVRGLELAIEADDSIRAIYTYDGSETHRTRYIATDDAAISAAVLACPSEPARQIFQRLRDRRLFKQVAEISIDSTEIQDSVILKRLGDLDDQTRSRLEGQVAALLNCEPWAVIVHKKTVKNPAYQAPGTLDPEGILVLNREGTLRSFHDYAAVAMAKYERAEHLHVIAPSEVPAGLNDRARQKTRDDLATRIRTLIIKELGGTPN